VRAVVRVEGGGWSGCEGGERGSGEGAPGGVDQRVCCHGREERGRRGAARQECCGMHRQWPPPEPVARGARLPAVAVGLLGPWQWCGYQLLMGRHPTFPVAIILCVGHKTSDVHTWAVTARRGWSVSRPDLHERAVGPSSEPLHLQRLSRRCGHSEAVAGRPRAPIRATARPKHRAGSVSCSRTGGARSHFVCSCQGRHEVLLSTLHS
jgi:hypothetical protein